MSWLAFIGRLRALKQKREESRNKPKLHIECLNGQITSLATPSSEPRYLRLFINDLSKTGLSAFTKDRFDSGERVEIKFETPFAFTIRGTVVSCRNHAAETKVISSSPFHFRIAVDFLYQDKVTEQWISTCCRRLSSDLLTKTEKERVWWKWF